MRFGNRLAILEPDESTIRPSLIFDEKDVYLIDAGFAGQFDKIVDAMAKEGFSPSQLTGIIITHQDGDHIGGLKEAIAAAPNAVVLAHEAEAPYIEGKTIFIKLTDLAKEYESMPPERKAWYDSARENWKKICAPVAKTLIDGEVLPIAGGVRIIHTPGHTPGHICLYVEAEKALITGDALNAADGALMGPKPQYTHDMDEALDSVGKLRAFDIEKILCYHGGLVEENISETLANLLNK